ncbi:MAG: hypothetical protein KAV45_00620 [Calditrichia bacterium]|nr:hypothetical protein [Calditrichia bacterium]
MPGIGGYWTSHSKLPWGNKTQKFINPMVWRKKDQIKVINVPDKGVLLTSVASPTLNISDVDKDRIYYSVFYGKLYSINNEKALTELDISHRLIVDEYLKNGPEFLARVEGAYLLAIYDYLRDELSIMNDPFGSLPLNYYLNKNELIFSSQIQSIQSLISTRLDESAFAEHLSMGITLNGKTFLKDIYRLWPGTVVKISRQGYEKIHYFKPVYAISPEMSIKRKLKMTLDNFNTSIKENLNPDLNTAAALSGGFDSRLIWGAVYSQNIPATATTFGETAALDIKIAYLIAKTLNISHEAFILNQETLTNFTDKAEKLINMTEGFTNVESTIVIPYYQWLIRKYQVMIDGTGSALYRRQVFRRNSSMLRSKDVLPVFIFNSHQFGDGETDPDKAAFLADHQSEIFSNLEEYFTKYRDYGTIKDLIDLFYLHHYIGFRFSSDIMLQTQYIDFFHPFCNTSIYQLIRGFSVGERRKLLFHKYAIHHFESRLESIPLVNSGLLVPYRGFRMKRVIPIGLAILNERYKINIIPKRYKRCPVFNFKEAYRENLLPFVEDILLDHKTQSRPFWNGKVLERNLRLHREQKINFTSTITNIITAELFLRRFIDAS